MMPGYAPQNGYIVLNNVSKNYRQLLALDNASFDIHRGDIFGYIGPNGSGKTTTIKIMVGLLRDFRGSVLIKGQPISNQIGANNRLLGYLPQNAAFQEWRTVNHALTTFGRLSGLGGSGLQNRIRDVLGMIGVLEFRNKRIVQLSGGTAQKVGMAQAILHEPELLILDEPMAGLDPASRYQFKNIFRGLNRNGTTIFFSSHILSDVQDLANRIGILNQGRVMHVGTMDDLRAKLRVAKEIDVVLAEDSGRWKGLASLDGVKGLAQPVPNRLLFQLHSEADVDDIVDKIIKGLLESGCRIRSVSPVTPTLEELYIKYLGGAVVS